MAERFGRLWRAASAATFALLLVPEDSNAQTDRFLPGEIVERVVSLSDSTQSYALFVAAAQRARFLPQEMFDL